MPHQVTITSSILPKMVGENNANNALTAKEHENSTTSLNKYHENMSDTHTCTTSTNNDNSTTTTNGNGEEEDMQAELRPLLLDIITTIRVKLDFIEADVERVNTLDELYHKKHYLNVLQEITRILAAFPRSDGYEAKELPESFSGKPRLIAFRNNMNFMLWENNSKLHLINDYVSCTDAVNNNKLSLVLNVVNAIRAALEVVGEYDHSYDVSSHQIGVGDTGSIVAHLNEFAEKRWAERGRQVVRPARYSATTFAGSSRKFMEKMRLQVDYTLENLHSSGNFEDSFLSFDSSPATTRFARSPSVSSIPVPGKSNKATTRRETSNFLLPRFALSPFTPDYSRPGGWSGSPRGQSPNIFSQPNINRPPASEPRPNTNNSDPPDLLRRSNSFQGGYSSPVVSKTSPPIAVEAIPPAPLSSSSSSPSSTRSRSPLPPSPTILRSASLSKDFSQTVMCGSVDDSEENSAYPESPPPSPPIITSASFTRKAPFQSLRLEQSSSSLSDSSISPSSSFRASYDYGSPGEEDRDDPFDYRSIQSLPSFNVDTNPRTTPTSSHPTSTSLPSRFAYAALLSPVLPPNPVNPRKQRASIAVNDAFRKLDMSTDGINAPMTASKAESERLESERLLRRSSSDSIRVPGAVRARFIQISSVSAATDDANSRTPSPGSRLKFEMDVPFSDMQGTPKSESESAQPKPLASPALTMNGEAASSSSDSVRSKSSSTPISPTSAASRRFTQQHRKRNISISFAFRQWLGKGDRPGILRFLAQNSPTSSGNMGKVEEAIMSRAASFKSDWLCPAVITPGYRIDMGTTNIIELPTCMNIMDLDLDILYYNNEFLGKEHYNFLGTARGINGMPGKPVGISMKFAKAENNKFGEITALVRTIERDERVTIAFQPNLLTSTTPSRKRLIKLLQKKVPRLKDSQLEEIRDPKLHTDFERFEAQLRVTRYKFGVLYCAEDQTDENEIYSNVSPSRDFSEFLQVLGTSIELQGWKRFRGGLDVKENTTGTHSVYTNWNDYEIMFHVAPLLPYDAADEQRVERKRHIGNDIVVVIFKDGPSPINPAIFKSHFNHVFLVVQKDHAKSDMITHYRITFICKDEVPVFGPMYPHSYSFPNTTKFREFILTKLVNAERAAMHSPVFFSKTKRTRQELLHGFSAVYSSKKP